MDSVSSIRPLVANSATAPVAATPATPAAPDTVTLGAQPKALAITLHVPAGEGQFQQIRKFPTRLGDHITTPEKGEIFLEHTNKAQFVTRATVQGDVVYRVPVANESVSRLASSLDGTRAYLSSMHHIVALDTASGATKGDMAFAEDTYGRKFTPQPDGKVVVLDGKSIVWADADLKEERRLEFPWEVTSHRPLQNGAMLVQGPNDFYHLGEMQIRSSDGKVTFQSQQVRPAATAILPDGRVQVLEYNERHTMSLVTIDPEKGEIGRVDAPTSARGVFPLANGTSLVYSRDYDEISSTFTLHAPDGTALRTTSFERAGRPRNFLMDEAREQAYVVIQSNTESQVFRLDLHATAGDDKPVEIARAPHNLVVLPVFADGRLAIAGPDGVTVYGAESTDKHPTIQAFKDAVGSPELQLNRVLGDTPYEDRASIDQWLPVIAKNVRIADGRGFVDPKAAVGAPRRGPDRCFDFPRTVDGATALKTMHIPNEGVYQSMVMGRRDGATGDMAFPDGAGHLRVEAEKVSWTLPGQTEPTENKHLDVTGALPVKAGDDYFIALGEHAKGTERVLSWCDPLSKTFERFDVTEAITGLYGGEAVYAVGAHGAVLMLEPPLAEGERLETAVSLPKSLAEASAAEGGKIVQSEDTVVIGGIVLRRRTDG